MNYSWKINDMIIFSHLLLQQQYFIDTIFSLWLVAWGIQHILRNLYDAYLMYILVYNTTTVLILVSLSSHICKCGDHLNSEIFSFVVITCSLVDYQ